MCLWVSVILFRCLRMTLTIFTASMPIGAPTYTMSTALQTLLTLKSESNGQFHLIRRSCQTATVPIPYSKTRNALLVMDNSRIFITGANGQLGKALATKYPEATIVD